jgi:hypothetical protein
MAKTVTIFDAKTPANPSSDSDSNSVELGVKFRTSVGGAVVGVRFFKTTGNTGTHTGTLWSTGGDMLATGTFTDETSTGWQELTFDHPVTIAAGTTYIASYHAPNGHYAADLNGLSRAKVNGPLTALANNTDGKNSVYRYNGSTAFPINTWQAANYWVDVRFFPTGGANAYLPTDGPTTTQQATTTTQQATTTTQKATTTTQKATTTTQQSTTTQPSGGVTLRQVDGGPNYYGKWANSLSTDPSFFPIAVFNESLGTTGAAAKYKAVGVNGFVGLWNGWSSQIHQEVLANGQWVFTAPDSSGAPAGYGDEWAGYQYFDEADGQNICGNVPGWLQQYCYGSSDGRTAAGGVQAMSDAIRRSDPSRPVFGQYTKGVSLGEGVDLATRKAYAAAVDIVSYDYYPITDPWESSHDLWNQYDAVTQTRGLTNNTKPVWVFIETSRLFGPSPMGNKSPSPAEIQAEVWQSIIGGARGIEYFNNNFSGQPTYSNNILIDPNYATVDAAISTTNHQIQALAPVINAPFADNYLTVTGGSVNAMVKFYNGHYYLFVGTTSYSNQTVTMKLNGVGNTTATVVNENRSVNVSNGTFSDSFTGETGVHIYEIN